MSVRAVFGCLLVLLLTGSWQASSAMQRPAPLYLAVIVMDGFRPDYATLAPMHHLHALMARGMTYDTAWVGQMESETPTGHATINTGVYPRKHGVTGFGFRDTATSQFSYLPTDLKQIRAGALTHLIENGGVPTLSDLIRARNQHDLTVSLSGEKYYASATMGAGADYVLYGKDFGTTFRPVSIGPNVPPAASHFTSVTANDSYPEKQDQFAASLAIQMLRTVRPRALFLNLPGTDIGGHAFGGIRDPQDMASIIRGADYAIGRVVAAYQALGLLDRTLLVVVADHGMASNRHIVPIHPMYNTVRAVHALSLDEEFRITVGSIWLRDPQQASMVASAMVAKRFPGVEGAFYKISTAAGSSFVADPATAARLPHSLLRAYIDLANTEAGPTGPEVLLPYGEDTTGLLLKGHKLWGTHGGFSWGVQHIPLVLAGPGVRTGVSHFPAKLVDVAPTIERLLGLPIPSGVDGLVLADALKVPTAAERSAQGAVRTGRLQDVQTLRDHSLAQSR